jgi:hypothetical protein
MKEISAITKLENDKIDFMFRKKNVHFLEDCPQ